MDANIEWLKHRVEQYRANKTDACEAIDDFDELDKLAKDLHRLTCWNKSILVMALCPG